LGFVLSMGVGAVVFMGVSSLAVAVVFHAMRGMYLHAERLLAKAGRQGAGGGVSPMLGEEAEGWNGKHERSEGLHKRSAEDWGNPLRRARAAPSARFGFLIRAH
jgi:hypothetical protein